MSAPFAHYLKFTDETSAKAALPDYWLDTDDGWSWRRDVVDGPIPVMIGTGSYTTDPDTGAQVETMAAEDGCHLNLYLPQMRTDLPGLLGIRDETGLVSGDHPNTPQRVVAR